MKAYVTDLREFLKEGSIPERKALIRNFVKDIKVKGGEATLTYTLPMPNGGITQESASVLTLVQPPLPSSTIRSSHHGSFFFCRRDLLAFPSRDIINPLSYVKVSSQNGNVYPIRPRH